jgi:flagellar assembly factor FliW
MKVSPDLFSTEHVVLPTQHFTLPEGLVGLPDYRSFSLSAVPDQLPFLWLHLHGPDPLHFVVIEPAGVIPDYELELFDEDAAFLGIADSADALVLNIVTVRPGSADAATVNLAGPIVIHRRTGRAKQCVLANYARYSAHHPLLSSAAAGPQA